MRNESSRTIRHFIFGAPLLLCLWGPGCGGIVTDSRGVDGGDGFGSGEATGASGRSTGTGGRSTGVGGNSKAAGGSKVIGTGGTVSKSGCGNGVVESGEDCDRTLGGVTCSSATMGSKPVGTVRCTSTCRWDLSGCSGRGTGGAVGTGGVTGVGARSTGGSVGMAGTPVTVDKCLNTQSLPGPDCTLMCGCNACPDAYAACRGDGGCDWILACAHGVGCASLQQCYATQCSSIINHAGGLNSSGAVYADRALACLAKSGCGIACP